MNAQIPTELTIQEKASLTTGRDFWSTSGLDSAGLPAVVLTDGPHGLRLQAGASDHLGLADSVPATCFPPAVTLGSSFDVSLLERVGAAIGAEARAQGVGVVLGPGVNIKRSPLCGRNFEYLSEDPMVSGVLGSALVDGLQSQDVGASLKHFAANNQEADRMRVSADVDPRPLREIYLRGFERVVRNAQPWTVMCSYNRINGVSAAENRWLLTDVLREDWGFDGIVVSDWGAVTDRVRSLKAGLDLEMPGNPGNSIQRISDAIASGELEESVLDESVVRLAEFAKRARPATGPADLDANHALAREAAGKGIVLLKNEGDVLPVSGGHQRRGHRRIRAHPALPGRRFLAGQPDPRGKLPRRTARRPGPRNHRVRPRLLAGRRRGTRSRALCRGRGRRRPGRHRRSSCWACRAPSSPRALTGRTWSCRPSSWRCSSEVRAANPNVAVALVGGGVVEMPFADDVPAVLEAWLGGQAGGGALADVVTGAVNPSGRLAETIPLRLEDTPAALDFPGEHGHVRYGEGIFVGYRWYDARKAAVRYPFGHGLSYTDFEYTDLDVQRYDDGLRATVTLRNTGSVAGREIVQLYVGLPGSGVARAPRSLAAFACVELAAGESTEVELLVDRSELAYWDTRVEGWTVEPGTYEVTAASSSRDVRLSAGHRAGRRRGPGGHQLRNHAGRIDGRPDRRRRHGPVRRRRALRDHRRLGRRRGLGDDDLDARLHADRAPAELPGFPDDPGGPGPADRRHPRCPCRRRGGSAGPAVGS